MQVQIVAQRLADKRIALTVTDAALAELGQSGYSPQYGARPLRRAIQDKILTPIATLMVGQGVMEGGTVNVSIKAGQPHFDVRKTAVRAKKSPVVA